MIEAKLDEVIRQVERARIRVSEHHIVKIVAVSKYVGSAQIEALYKSGQRAFGESRVQDLKSKCDVLESLPLEWHFIGRLQSNKINALLSLNPSLVHSVDSYEKALEINKRATKSVACLLQINSAKEASKMGVMPEKAIEEYLRIKEELPNIALKGLMSFGSFSENTQEVKKSFEITHSLYEKLQKEGATVCSMGMSGDFELAIECGSNMIRVGSKIFK